MLLKDLEAYIEKNNLENEQDLMSDTKYVCKSCALITEALQKGCDVMQLANGDIIITELKAVTFQYSWDAKKGKMVRSQFGKNRTSINRQSDSDSSSFVDDIEEVEEFA